jgi:uncharacterized protein YbjT (DUF2867 family)
MQNISLDMTIRSGKLLLAFSPDNAHGFVDLADVAIVAREVILHPTRHNFAFYELVAQNISYTDIARIIGRACSKAIICDVVPAKEFVERRKAAGEVPNDITEDAVERLMIYYDRW